MAAKVSRSFRDPAGYVIRVDGRILRVVEGAAISVLGAFLRTNTARGLTEAGKLIGTRLLGHRTIKELDAAYDLGLSNSGGNIVVYEHDALDFPSYPYEWAPAMLYAAACLTLELESDVLTDGFGLKDATPYNILFRGPYPVFVDLLSFEHRDVGDSNWLPYAQFLRSFLLPLAAVRMTGLRLDALLLSRRDGIEPEELYRTLSWPQRLRPPYLSLVTLPTWLGEAHDPRDVTVYDKRPGGDPEKAQFILECFLRHARRNLDRLRPKFRESNWTRYTAQNSYTSEQAEFKQRFVGSALSEFAPARVLDVGCNTGQFSLMAARAGATVVAIDSDPEVIGALWQEAVASDVRVLPLVINLARPSPAIGWRYTECTSFLERARQNFDAVMMLAVLHHLLVTERIPLQQVIELAAEITKEIAIIEFVAPSDPMFRQIARGRENLHSDLTTDTFEAACAMRFEILRSEHIPGAARWLYLLRKSKP